MTETTAVSTGGAADPAAHGAAAQTPARRAAGAGQVIGNESTIEIPVHLLFREEGPPGGTGAMPVAGRKTQTRKAVRLPVSDRPSPVTDPRVAERPGPSLPGAVAVLGGIAALAGLGAVLWRSGLVPEPLTSAVGLQPRPFHGIGPAGEVLLVLLAALALFAFLGLDRGRSGYAVVLSRCGDYRGSVRRAGLLWTSPLLTRHPVDVRLRYWRGEPIPVVDAEGTPLRVALLVVWRVRDTAKAVHAVANHEEYFGEQVGAAVVRVCSQWPADTFGDDAPTLRDADAVGEALTRVLTSEAAPVGIEVFSAQPTRIDYAPEVAAVMQRRRLTAIDARHRDSVLTSVVDAVEDTVARLTDRGLVTAAADERTTLVKDLTVAFYAGRG